MQNKWRDARLVREAHSQPRFFLRALLLSTPALFHARSMCICAFRARKREVYYRACPAISILSRHDVSASSCCCPRARDAGTRNLILRFLNRSSVRGEHEFKEIIQRTLVNYANSLYPTFAHSRQAILQCLISVEKSKINIHMLYKKLRK